MKTKTLISSFIALSLCTMLYAKPKENNTFKNLKNEIATTVEAEVETQVATEKILQEYISFCGGNEDLGEKLYKIRDGKDPPRRRRADHGIPFINLLIFPRITAEKK